MLCGTVHSRRTQILWDFSRERSSTEKASSISSLFFPFSFFFFFCVCVCLYDLDGSEFILDPPTACPCHVTETLQKNSRKKKKKVLLKVGSKALTRCEACDAGVYAAA